MNNFISSSTIDAIQKAMAPIAAAIGQGATGAWAIVVRQQYAEGFTGLIFSCILLAIPVIFCLVMWISAIKYDKREAKRHEDGAKPYDKDVMSMLIGTAIFGTITTVFIAVFMSLWIYTSVLKLMNPDYYALQFMVQSVTGHEIGGNN